MSMPTPDNPHYVRRTGYSLVYWRGNEASGPSGANRVVIEQDTGHSVVEFKLPDQAGEVETMERVLIRAFNIGRKYQSAEVRKVLGI